MCILPASLTLHVKTERVAAHPLFQESASAPELCSSLIGKTASGGDVYLFKIPKPAAKPTMVNVYSHNNIVIVAGATKKEKLAMQRVFWGSADVRQLLRTLGSALFRFQQTEAPADNVDSTIGLINILKEIDDAGLLSDILLEEALLEDIFSAIPDYDSSIGLLFVIRTISATKGLVRWTSQYLSDYFDAQPGLGYVQQLWTPVEPPRHQLSPQMPLVAPIPSMVNTGDPAASISSLFPSQTASMASHSDRESTRQRARDSIGTSTDGSARTRDEPIYSLA